MSQIILFYKQFEASVWSENLISKAEQGSDSFYHKMSSQLRTEDQWVVASSAWMTFTFT